LISIRLGHTERVGYRPAWQRKCAPGFSGAGFSVPWPNVLLCITGWCGQWAAAYRL